MMFGFQWFRPRELLTEPILNTLYHRRKRRRRFISKKRIACVHLHGVQRCPRSPTYSASNFSKFRESKSFRPKSFSFTTKGFVVLRDCGKAQNFPIVAKSIRQEPPSQVVFMPTGLNENNRSIGS